MKYASPRFAALFALTFAASLAAAQDAAPKEVVLFDGTSTAGWKQAGPGTFELADGVITSRGGMGLFWHEREFGDFRLTLEFKVNRPQANSGVFVRFPDPGNDPWVAVRQGHEIQICDAQKGNQTGAVYDHKDSTKLASKPAGEWNDYRIECVGQRYTITLNGQVVNEYAAKRGLRGHVGLQNHDDGSAVSFRNVRVVGLPGPGAAAAGPSGAPAAVPTTQVTLEPVPAAPDLLPGLVGEYVNDPDARGLQLLTDPGQRPFLVRADERLAFNNTDGEFHGTKLGNNFAARWTGLLRVPAAGTYTIGLRSDDGSRLYLGDQLVLDHSGLHDMKEEKQTAVAFPAAGDYRLRLEYHQGGGGAGVVVNWTPPGGKTSAVPPEAFAHAKDAAAVAWDKAAWEQHKFDYKQWAATGPRHVRMDYGPFVSHTIAAPYPEGNVTNKGVAVTLDGGAAGVLFDTETGRYAAGWTGGFLNLKGVAFDGAHGPNPSIRGEQLFGTKPGPGWANPSGSFDDPRPNGLGPMPKEWFKYKGLYRHGDQVVFSYSVNGVDVLDAARGIGVSRGIMRQLHIGPGKALTVALNEDRPEQRLSVGGCVQSRTSDGRTTVTFPPRNEPTTYWLLISDEPLRLDAALLDFPSLIAGGPALWGEPIITEGKLGTGDGPYVVDTLTAPDENPFHSWMRFGGIDAFADGRLAVCTWSGDVWVVSGVDASLKQLKWKRYATGLFQALGLRIVKDQVYVLGRDQITRLHDLNADGEADFYENFNNDVIVTPSFHEFALDLHTDAAGNFYFAKGGPVRPGGRGWQTITDHNGCVLRVSADGSKLDVFARGVRAPNGMGISPDGTRISVADNEGTWTPTCRITFVNEGDFLGVPDFARDDDARKTSYGDPVCWLPHGEVDNSSGGQVWVPLTETRWGPLAGQMLHMSYGKCALYLVLPEQAHGRWQGGVVRFPLSFDTGICRGQFNPADGQLYVTGLKGWQTTAARDGAVQRVRYTGKPLVMPIGLKADADGLAVTFSAPLDKEAAVDADNYAAERWNYLWSSAYGSPQVSVEDPKRRERDPVDIEAAAVSDDGRTVTLKVADMKPAMQYKVQLDGKAADGTAFEWTLYNTVNTTGPDSKPPGVMPAEIKPPDADRIAR